jgi:hypothetical protein
MPTDAAAAAAAREEAIATAEKWIGALHRRVKIATYTDEELRDAIEETQIAIYALAKTRTIRGVAEDIMLGQLRAIKDAIGGHIMAPERQLIDCMVSALESQLEYVI